MKEHNLSVENIDSYIDNLINQVFSILPLYEEYGMSLNWNQKICNISYKVKGLYEISVLDSTTLMDVLCFINNLKSANNHLEVRNCVLKTCSLLSRLKVVNKE